jgi:hypothetical protein
LRRKYIKKTLSIFDGFTEVDRQVGEIEHAGIVIGIPGFNNEHTISREVGHQSLALQNVFQI